MTASNNVKGGNETQTVNIKMTVGQVTITATLDNSRTTSDFLKTLPRTMTMNRYDDREYYGKMESAISTEGEKIDDYHDGDVTYYPAGGSFAIFFADENKSSQLGLIRMGKITSSLEDFNKLGNRIEMKIDLSNKLATTIPMGRIGEPNEIANTVVFLLSDLSTYTTGADYVIDGAFLLR